nr:hypothetical protein [Pantoea sp. SM3]
MGVHTNNGQHTKECYTRKGLPEANPITGHAYEEDNHTAKNNPNEHGEIRRTRDDSEDHKHDPYGGK